MFYFNNELQMCRQSSGSFWEGIPHVQYVVISCWFRLQCCPIFYQCNLGYLTPSPFGTGGGGGGQDARQTRLLPSPLPLHTPPHSLPHLLSLSISPIILHASPFYFYCPSVLFIFCPHQHPASTFTEFKLPLTLSGPAKSNAVLHNAMLAESDVLGTPLGHTV